MINKLPLDYKQKNCMAKVNAKTNKAHYKTDIASGDNKIISDEPFDKGGQNLGLTPSELLCASLAACTSITLRMYSDRKEWPLEKIEVDVELNRDNENNITNFTRNIRLVGTLDDEQKKRLLLIADKCPVHKILSHQILITTIEI
ncbi:MAG: OsmC family protein [Bacteroidota bacterium]|nr:OsmC family protein [Bacteroidota bacterium]MDP3145430.1 OsmC family protein [Bacteroidota bacterium]MDP3557207.1 OsmC family protein [Bacteroidota bacterium]